MKQNNLNKLQVKDLVTIGIFSAIYFVINLIVMVSGGITPLLWIFMPPILSVLCGVILSRENAFCCAGKVVAEKPLLQNLLMA